jgi:hypothetical protein
VSAVDIGAVGAAKVAQYNASVSHIERRVTERNVRVIQYDLPRHRLAAD